MRRTRDVSTIVNLKAAKALGITIPQSRLLRADETALAVEQSPLNASKLAPPTTSGPACGGGVHCPMDQLAALDALGFTLPSTAYIIGAVAFGIIGFVGYRYGKKMSFPAPKWIGVALMLYPYATSQTWLLYAVGVGLCVGLYFSARG